MLLIVLFAILACVKSQHLLGHHYTKHGSHDFLDSAHGSHGHGHHGEHDEFGNAGYAKHGHHAVASHKEYDDKAAHHDAHQSHHDKGYYERNKGYGYEKAYAYDKIKKHHDIGSSHAAHGYEHAHHGKQGGHKLIDDSAHGYAKHAKKSKYGGHEYSNQGKLYDDNGAYHHSYDNRGHHAPVIAHHGYEEAVPVVHTAPVYAGPGHYGYVH